MTYRAGDESDDDDLYGPFSSGQIPQGLAHEVDSDVELDDLDDLNLSTMRRVRNRKGA